MVLVLGCANTEIAWADETSARADPDLKAAIDIYGELAAGLGISEHCPDILSQDEVAHIKKNLVRYVGFVRSLSGQHGISSKEASSRLNALGQHNLSQVREEISANGCSSRRLQRTIGNMKHMWKNRFKN
jgi:archaellum biogenesis protein FlaJ (TadC family)